MDLRSGSGAIRGDVAAVAKDDGVDEVVVEVIDEFDEAVGHGGADGDVVEVREMLHQFAQSDSAGVRADGNSELGGQEQDGKVLVDSAHTCRIDLYDIDRAGPEQLLEHDPVGHRLAGRYTHGLNSFADLSVPKDVVGAGRLFNPPRLVIRECSNPFHGLGDLPPLVGVDSDTDVFTDSCTGQGEAPPILVEVGADFEFDHPKPFAHGFLAEPDEFLVAVAQPSGSRGVGGVADGAELSGPLVSARSGPLEQIAGVGRAPLAISRRFETTADLFSRGSFC